MSVAAAGKGRFFRASRERLELLRERRREEGFESASASIPRRKDLAYRPLSFSQERLWFLDRLDPDNPAYTIPSSLRLRGRLDVAALARALTEVARRHEVLRATFHDVAGNPEQRVSSPAAVPLPLLDLGALPLDRREDEARRISASEEARPFRLSEGPLLRARLLRLADEEHALRLDVHHIVADGWSLGVLVRELTTLYGGRSLPELPIQYADYAAWQREQLAGDLLEQQLAYWRERLAGLPASLDLPTDRPRPAVQTFRGGHAGRVVPAALVDRLRSLAGNADASLFMVLLAGFQLLLARWSGQEDIPVGSPIAGRTRREVEDLIGIFLNHLVLRTDLSADPTFRELLARVREVAVDAYAHQDLPFEKLLAEIEPQRDLSRTPLFQVFFNLLSFPAPEIRLPALTVEGFDAPEPLAKFDMTLYLVEEGGGLRLDLIYNAALFDAARMEEALAQYELVLAQAAADPEARIGSFSLVTPAAKAVLPDPCEALDASWPGSVPEAVERHARETPDRPAVIWEGGSLTYAQVAEEMNRVAAKLRAAGVGDGDIVAIHGHRSAPLVPAILGVLESGAAFLILDPAYPEQRNAAILDVAKPKATLGPSPPGPLSRSHARTPGRGGGGEIEQRLPSAEERADSATFGGEDGSCAPPSPGGPGVRMGEGPGVRAAYLAFTSGSTGIPKGVLGLHRSLTHFYPWMQEVFLLNADDRFSLLSGLAHDPLHRDVFTPLWLGAAVAIPDPERMGEPGWLAGWVARMGITVAHLTPAMGRLLTEPPAGPMPSLRRAFFVGDMLTRRDVERFRALAPDVAVINLYGSTETQRAVGYHPIEEREEREVFPLGRGMPDAQLLVLNRAGRLAGIGEVGEVCVRSPHLAAGYLGDPVLTSERFFALEGVPVYRTGDLGRYRTDGEVEALGRADFQVKIRGFRVELGDVEAALARHPAIREAVVVARGEVGERRLVAYVVLTDPSPPSPLPSHSLPPGEGGQGGEELRSFLRTRLPEYMVPSAFVVLDALPLTPNRKVDRGALPEPPLATTESSAVEEIRTPTEEVLAGIWSEVLGANAIRSTDDFFGLGGHSLKVTQVLARVRQAFGVELPVRSLFESPTLAGLAARIDEALRAGSAAAAPPLVRVPRDGDFPLSFAQERLWFLQRLAPASAAYNMPAALRLRGSLDPAALERTLREIVRRHEALRTTFPEIDGEPRQRIQPFRPFPLPLTDLRCLPREVRETEAERIARAEAVRPFNLARGPLLRAALLRLEEREWVALFGLHHIVSDGWSIGVLSREMAALYAGSSLPELPVQVVDFAVWQRGWLQGEALMDQVRWWRETLADAPAVADLPLDRPRTAGSGPAGHVAMGLPPELAAALRELARRESSTLFMVLLATFQALLHRLTGDDDLVVGSPIANRAHPWLEGLIGFFVNTLALRSRLDDVDPGFRDLLRRTRNAALGAYAHQDLPFEKLVEELRVERSLRHSPVFQVMLVLQNAPMADLELPGLTLAPLPLAPGAAKFDLSLSFVETELGLRAALEYDAGLFEPITAALLLHRFGTVVAAVAGDPDCPLSALPVLGESERQQVVVEQEDGAGGGSLSREAGEGRGGGFSVHRRFEEWAAQSPEAIAIGVEGRTITYGELDRAANRLAHAIRAAGARLETRVAVSVARPEGWALGMLAVFKVGAAYVPLDPRLPPERLAFLLADSGAAVLVTEEALLGRLPQGETRTVCADRVSRFGPELPPGVDVPPEALAYVIYTSGSTGTPKGVGVPHGALARQVDAAARRLDLRPGDRLLGAHADGFDAAVEDTLAPLITGATLFPRGGALWSVSDFVKRIETWRITGVQMPTAYWRQVAAELDEAGHTLGPPLRRLEAGGEAMPTEAARQWLRVAPGARLQNGYGPTETVITPTFFEVAPGFRETPSGTVPIGRPLAGRAALVVDRWGRIAPLGVAGEVWFGEPLARGYLGQPDATAAAFVPHPNPEAPGERVYRTGDRVRFLPDGNLEYLGRLDRQLKLRGFRIEPGEIEAALTRLPEVREAAVVLADEPARLVAFLVAVGPERPEPDLLLAGLRGRLPDYMTPSAFVWLDALPLTGTGKVDRRALAGRAAEARSETGQIAPRDDLERELAAIWADLLGVRPVGVRDDFFALGGHSLLAVRLASRIEARFGRELPIAMLFERRTVGALAEWLRPAPAPRSSSPLVRIQPGGDRQPLFLVHPGGGGVLCYAELGRALGSDQPLFGLQAPGLDGDCPPLDDIGEMADLYLDAIRSSQPVGPCHLGGWSFGGLVAYEIACRLAEKGEPAGLVAILDTEPSTPDEAPDEAELLVRGLDEQFLQAVPFTADELRGLSTRDQVALILERARRAGQLPPDFEPRRAAGVVDVFKANLRAARAWRPRPYPGRITVFRAADRSHVGPTGSGGWDSLVEADVVTVPGDHLRMVAPPHVDALAQALLAALDRQP